jgi:hypothetical protein
MKRTPLFASESLLCQSFAAACREQSWVPYPETSGWDLLLVKGEVQIGIEAKLRPSLHLLAQAVERAGLHEAAGSLRDKRGPQYIGLLIPAPDYELEMVAHGFGFRVISPDYRRPFRPPACADDYERRTWPDLEAYLNHWPCQHFEAPAWLPPVVPTVAAGVPSPIRLTEWKMRALRLLALLEVRGWVTIADLRHFGMTPSRWYHHWLEPGEVKGRWVRRPGIVMAQDQHPEAFAVAVEQARAAEREGGASNPGRPVSETRAPEQLGIV